MSLCLLVWPQSLIQIKVFYSNTTDVYRRNIFYKDMVKPLPLAPSNVTLFENWVVEVVIS